MLWDRPLRQSRISTTFASLTSVPERSTRRSSTRYLSFSYLRWFPRKQFALFQNMWLSIIACRSWSSREARVDASTWGSRRGRSHGRQTPTACLCSRARHQAHRAAVLALSFEVDDSGYILYWFWYKCSGLHQRMAVHLYERLLHGYSSSIAEQDGLILHYNSSRSSSKRTRLFTGISWSRVQSFAALSVRIRTKEGWYKINASVAYK